MRILVTGGCGFVGSHLVEHLLVNTDWEVELIASFEHRGVAERLTDSEHYQANRERVKVHVHDLRAPLSDQLVERLGKIDYIVNLAAESHVDRSLVDPVPFVRNNVDVALNILEYARKARPLAFIQFSTDEVYGPAPKGTTHAEWSPILPSNPYSASKAAQEAIAISYWRTFGVPVVITNTMNVYGERQHPEKFLSKVIRSIVLDETLTVHGKPGQIGSRFYIHARNVADAILYLLRNHPPRAYPKADRPDRYNVVGEREIDNLKLAQMISTIIDSEKPLRYELLDFHSARPGHDARYALDGSKLAALGWKAPIPFKESLARTVHWYLAHPEWLQLPKGNPSPVIAPSNVEQIERNMDGLQREMRWAKRQRGVSIATGPHANI